MELDSETLDIAEGVASRRRDLPPGADNRWTTVRISTTSGSQEVALQSGTRGVILAAGNLLS